MACYSFFKQKEKGIWLLLFLLATAGSVPVQADEVSATQLQGSALYRRLDVDVYRASVYSPQADHNYWRQPGQPLTLRMDILSEHLSPRRFYRLWNEGLAINLNEAELNNWSVVIPEFANLLRDDLHAGDQVVISNTSGRCLVTINGVQVMNLAHGAFVNQLVAAWIGKFPQSARLREGLINADEQARSEMSALLADMHFRPGRDKEIRSWLQKDKEDSVAAELLASARTNELSLADHAGQAVTEAAADTENQPLAGAGQKKSKQPAAVEAASKAPIATGKKTDVAPSVSPKGTYLASMRYYRSILLQANRSAVYPRKALQRRMEGSVTIAVQLAADGHLISAETVESSGITLLDREALRAARAASPYAVVPAEMAADELRFDIPFRFALTQSD